MPRSPVTTTRDSLQPLPSSTTYRDYSYTLHAISTHSQPPRTRSRVTRTVDSSPRIYHHNASPRPRRTLPEGWHTAPALHAAPQRARDGHPSSLAGYSQFHSDRGIAFDYHQVRAWPHSHQWPSLSGESGGLLAAGKRSQWHACTCERLP